MSMHADSWWLIDELIKSFIASNPNAWASFNAEMTTIRATRANPKFADSQNKNSAHRWAASFPNGENGINLLDAILKLDRDILKDKHKWAELLRRYPAFRVPEKY